VSLGIGNKAGDMQAAAVHPAFVKTDDLLLVDRDVVVDHDVAVDSHSPSEKQPCAWRRRHRRELAELRRRLE